MNRPVTFELHDHSYQSLADPELLDQVREVKPPVMNAGAGDDDNEQIIPKLDLEGAGEGSGLSGAGLLSPKADDDEKGGGDQDPWQQELEELAFEAAAAVPRAIEDVDVGMICSSFSGLQLNELERVFQRTQYPDVFARKDLEILVNVVEADMERREPEQDNIPE